MYTKLLAWCLKMTWVIVFYGIFRMTYLFADCGVYFHARTVKNMGALVLK